MPKATICGAALSLTFLQAAVVAQELVREGVQFQVNSYITGVQERPSVGVGPNGGFVVVWQSKGSPGSDRDHSSIQGQRYSSSGAGLGSQFQVNSYTTVGQYVSSVSVGPNGEFVVVWHDDLGSPGPDNDFRSIQAQRYSSGGAESGAQFQVNTYTTGPQSYPAVSIGPDGGFVVVWWSVGSSGSDHDFLSIQGQRYSSSGVELGSQFQVNSYTTGGQSAPSVSMGSDGGFVVAWQSDGSHGSDNGSDSVQGQRYDSQGDEVGSEFQVNSYTTGDQAEPAVSVGPDRGFVVVWQSNGSPGSDNDNRSIQGQRYSSEGTELGSQFQVNTYATGYQYNASASMSPDGGFVVAWTSYGSSGSDTSISSIEGRRYGSGGAAIGPQFQVNTYTTSYQYTPSVSVGAGGHIVVTWSSDGSPGSDSAFDSVQGQRFAVPVPIPASPTPGGSALRLAVTLSALLGLLLLLRARA